MGNSHSRTSPPKDISPIRSMSQDGSGSAAVGTPPQPITPSASSSTTPPPRPKCKSPETRVLGPRRPPQRYARPSNNTPPTPPTEHPSNHPPVVTLTPMMLHEREKLTQALQLRYRCSAACATSTVNCYYPDEEKCRATIEGKMTAPFVLAVGMVPKQREYITALCDDLLAAFRHLPYLQGTFTPAEADEDAGDGSSPGAVDWAEVRARLLSPAKAPLWHMHAELVYSSEGQDVRAYENAYQSLIAKEGFRYVIGCYASGDGVLPAVDYVNARLCGASVQSLARRMHFSDEVIDALDGVEAEAPTPHYTDVNVFGNDPATACPLRQDKGQAQRQLKAAGLAYIRHLVTTDADEAVAQIEDGTLLLPVVVKPNTGAGSEFVTLCGSASEIRVAFSMVQGVFTSQGTDASQLVVEEYIDGPEYVVNTVSYHGVHVVTDVWESWKYPSTVVTTGLTRSAEEEFRAAGTERSRKPKTSILYEKQTLINDLASLPPEHDARRITEYTLRCLDALGLENGCGHSELRLDTRMATRERQLREEQQHHPDAGEGSAAAGETGHAALVGEPVLIELNSRMQGDTPRSTEVVGYDQYSLLVYIAEAANVFGGATGASTALRFRMPSTASSSSLQPPPPQRVGEIPWPPVPRLYRALPTTAPTLATRVLFLAARVDCVLNGAALAYLERLPTFKRFTRTIFKPNQPGFVTPLRQTVDLFSSPTSCVMQGPASEVAADCATIRAMEAAPLPSQARAATQKLIALGHETSRLRENVRILESRLQAVTEAYRDVAVLAGAASLELAADGGSEALAPSPHHQSQSPGDAGALGGEGHSYQRDLEALRRSLSALQTELEWARSNLAAYERRGQMLHIEFTRALAEQRPPALYVGYPDFSKLKIAGVANDLAVL